MPVLQEEGYISSAEQYTEFWNRKPPPLNSPASITATTTTTTATVARVPQPVSVVEVAPKLYSSALYIQSPDSGVHTSRLHQQQQSSTLNTTPRQRAASSTRMTTSQNSMRRSTGSMDRVSSARRTIDPDLPEIKNVKDSRREMHSLNEKLASQLEKIRFLTAENQKLYEELNSLKANWGRETEKVRIMYDEEMRQLRNLLDEAERQKSDSQAKVASLQQGQRDMKEELNFNKRNTDKMGRELDETMGELTKRESELLNLQRRCNAMEDQANQMRAMLDKTTQDLKSCTKSLDEETALRMSTQSEMQTLREELDFLRRVHEQQLREMQELAAKTDHQQTRDKWQNEFSRALHDIQQEYDKKQKEIQEELENHFAMKLRNMNKLTPQEKQEIVDLRNENEEQRNFIEKLRNQISKLQHRNDHLENSVRESADEIEQLRHRLDADYAEAMTERRVIEEALTKTRDEMADLMDTKLNLEAEIAAYRHLLEAQDGIIGTMSTSVTPVGPGPTFSSTNSRPSQPRPTSSTTVSKQQRWPERGEPTGASSRSRAEYDQDVYRAHHQRPSSKQHQVRETITHHQSKSSSSVVKKSGSHPQPQQQPQHHSSTPQLHNNGTGGPGMQHHHQQSSKPRKLPLDIDQASDV